MQTVRVTLQERGGQLYFAGARIAAEMAPGLFFTATGEALDLRGPSMTWRNIPLRHVDASPPSDTAP